MRLIDADALEERLDKIPARSIENADGRAYVLIRLSTVFEIIKQMPSAQPFHNITMSDVLKYIDNMPEDVWQEFTACLECRGWELQRRTAKWCGSEFV